jgi:hypothetical protein
MLIEPVIEFVAARGVGCPAARSLLNRTTLTSIRRGRRAWTFGGYQWRFKAISVSSARLTGTAEGHSTTAIFSVT